MYPGMFSSVVNMVIASCAVLFIVQTSEVSAATAAGSATNFEIPISELNTVKKRPLAKRTTSERKKKKKSENKHQAQAAESAAPQKPDGEAKTKPAEAAGTAKNLEASPAFPDAVRSSSVPEDTLIHHTTYSFVVTGKRTVIHAVINSKTDVRDVNCALAASEGGMQTPVKMEKVDGTRFTYKATLPALPPGSPALRYTITVVDSLGKETRSQEYATPVTSSPVVPGWQLENDVAVPAVAQPAGDSPRKELSAPAAPSNK